MFLKIDKEEYERLKIHSQTVSGRHLNVRLIIVGKHINKPISLSDNNSFVKFKNQTKEYSYFNQEIKAIYNQISNSSDFIDILDYCEFQEVISSGGNGGKCTFGL